MSDFNRRYFCEVLDIGACSKFENILVDIQFSIQNLQFTYAMWKHGLWSSNRQTILVSMSGVNEPLLLL